MVNQLKPYLTLIKVVIGVLLLGVAFVGGCKWEKNSYAEEKAELNTVISSQKLQLTALTSSLEEINKQALANKEAAEAAKERAEEAALEATKARAKLAREQAAWDKKFEAAKKDPDCKELLERQLCPLIDSF